MAQNEAPAQNSLLGQGSAMHAFGMGPRVTGKILTVVVPIIFKLVFFVLTFGLVALLGATKDRPSNVYEREEEGRFSQRNQWVSAFFYTSLSLAAVIVAGPVGFIPLALAVLVVARRRCAAEYVPYQLGTLRENIATVLADRMRLKIAVMVGMGLTTILYSLRMLTLPVDGYGSAAAAITWGLWIFITLKAANLNLQADTDSSIRFNNFATIFAKAFGGTLDEWHRAKLDKDGEDIVATNFPLGAVLKYDGADEILAKIAPKWELDPESDEHTLTLHRVSPETEERRIAEAASGGLIGARIETGQASEPAFAGFSITDDDLR